MLGIVYDPADLVKNQFFADRLVASATSHNTEAKLITSDQITNNLDQNSVVLLRSRDPKVRRALHLLGCTVINHDNLALIGNDKLALARWCMRANIPHPQTVPSSQWWRLPNEEVVTKPRFGHGGVGVQRHTHPAGGRASLSDAVVIQTFLNGANSDLRAWVLGDAIIAWVRRHNPTDFRSNLSQGAIATPASPSHAVHELAERLRQHLPEGFYGIDIIEAPDGPILMEIEDVVGSRALYRLGIADPADLLIRWILNQLPGV
ncbi:MAG: ATP-grasp domain-containing protein [Ferrimicrobium sp.]